MSSRRRRTALSFGFLAGVLATITAALPGAGADLGLVFDGQAEAFGARMTLTVPGAPISERVIDVSAPTSSAQLSSIGTMSGFASLPSPGETVLSAPGLIAAVAQQGVGGLPTFELPALPDYPMAVSADSANPEVSGGAGPYELLARASLDEALGRARAGLRVDALGAVALSTSESSVVQDGSRAVARAVATVDGLTIGPLSFGQLRSTAEVSLEEGGAPEPTSSFVVDGARIAGLPISLTPDGIAVEGTTVEAPASRVVSQVLESAGISLEWAEPTQDDRSATSPGITIRRAVDAESLGLGTGMGNMALTLGSVTASMAAPDGAAPVAGAPPLPTPTPTPPAVTDSVALPETPIATGELPSTDLPSAPTGAPTGGSSPVAPEMAAVGDVELTGLAEDLGLESIYLATAIGALAVLALGVGTRHLGVRRT